MTRPTVVGLLFALSCWLAPVRAAEPVPPPFQPPIEAPATQQARAEALPGPILGLPRESLEVRAFRLTQEWEHAPIVLDAADAWGLSPWLLLALLWVETGLDCDRVNPYSKAAGCGQFTRTGIRGLNRIRALRGDDRVFTRQDAFDPEKGIHATAELLSWLVDRYGTRPGVRSYNGGRYQKVFLDRVFRKVRALRLAAGLPPALPPRPQPQS